MDSDSELKIPIYDEPIAPYSFTIPKYERPGEVLSGERELLQHMCTTVKVDDQFEALNMVCTEQMNAKIQEIIDYRASVIYNTKCSDPTLAKILVFFGGRTVTDRKKTLLYFLEQNPALRTNNLELLLQRVAVYFKFHDKLKEIEEMGPTLKQCIDSISNPPEEQTVQIDE